MRLKAAEDLRWAELAYTLGGRRNWISWWTIVQHEEVRHTTCCRKEYQKPIDWPVLITFIGNLGKLIGALLQLR